MNKLDDAVNKYGAEKARLMSTRTQETAQSLRVLADKIEGLGLDGVWLSMTDMRVGNANLTRPRRTISVDRKGIRRATHITFDRHRGTVQAFIQINRAISVPVFIAQDVHFCFLDSVWTDIARVTRDLPPALRKRLFAQMHGWREAELDEKRAEMAILAHKLAELENALDRQ